MPWSKPEKKSGLRAQEGMKTLRGKWQNQSSPSRKLVFLQKVMSWLLTSHSSVPLSIYTTYWAYFYPRTSVTVNVPGLWYWTFFITKLLAAPWHTFGPGESPLFQPAPGPSQGLIPKTIQLQPLCPKREEFSSVSRDRLCYWTSRTEWELWDHLVYK